LCGVLGGWRQERTYVKAARTNNPKAARKFFCAGYLTCSSTPTQTRHAVDITCKCKLNHEFLGGNKEKTDVFKWKTRESWGGP